MANQPRTQLILIPCPTAALVASLVPFGKVPFKMIESVPFTTAERTKVELRFVPSPTTVFKNV